MLKVPSLNNRYITPDGRIVAGSALHLFLQQFTQGPSGVQSVLLTGSPFSYTVLQQGTVAIQGGTVSAVSLNRGGTVINLTGASTIPVGQGDIITVTYSVAPTITFIPTY